MTIRVGDSVKIKGEGHLTWEVLHVGHAVGVHYPLVWVKCLDGRLSPKSVPLADVVSLPVDLEDFPTGPI